MSKVVKGIGKAIKGIFRGVKKVFKKVVESDIGKAILVAAAVYVTGGMMGAWGTPWTTTTTTMTNAAAGGGTAASAGTQLAATGTTSGLSGTAATAATTAARLAPTGMPGMTVTAAQSAAPTITAGQLAGATGTTIAANMTTPTPKPDATAPELVMNTPKPSFPEIEAEKVVSKPGVTGRILDSAQKLAKWSADNPIPAAMALNATAAAFSPDELDLLREQYRLRAAEEDRLREKYRQNLQVGGTNLGIRPTQRPLTDMYGQPVYDSRGSIFGAMGYR